MLAKPLRAPLIWRGGASALAAVRDYLDPISIIGLYIFVLWLWLMSAVDRQDFRAAFDSMLARSLAMRLQMRKALVPSRWRALALRLFQLSKRRRSKMLRKLSYWAIRCWRRLACRRLALHRRLTFVHPDDDHWCSRRGYMLVTVRKR